MGTIKKILVLFFALIIIYYLWILVLVISKNYSWKDMDWNQDGSTSISEFFSSNDIGIRRIKDNDRNCSEYFSYKDGLPIKLVCD